MILQKYINHKVVLNPFSCKLVWKYNFIAQTKVTKLHFDVIRLSQANV